MNKTLFTIPLILMGMLLVFSSTAIAHEGEDHGKEMYEEGSGGVSMEMGRGSRAMTHEYKEGQNAGMEHSKEYYEKKYGKYEHEKNKMRESGNTMMDEGSGMKEEAMRMKEMEHQRREEGSKM